MSKLSRAEGFTEYFSADEDRLKKTLAEIDRISAELRLEDAISKINRLAEDLRNQSTLALKHARQ
jgi:hypothetical protein